MQSDECRVTSDESRPLRPTAIRKGRIGAVGKGGLCTLHSTLVTGFLLLFSFTCTRDWKNPYDDVNYNTPPTARVRLSHTAGTVDTLFIADASGSFDAEDSTADLKFRWDWESDGTWDNDWSYAAIDSHRFTEGGVKAVKLAVQDRGGMADTIIMALGVNSPPVAAFSVTPRLSRFEYTANFSAAASYDNEDSLSLLEFRWDFDGSGVWSDWTGSHDTSCYYDIPGKDGVYRRTVRCQVRDRLGLTAQAETTVTIDFHPGMKRLAGGTYAMGGTLADELPVHQVTVSPFWMDSVEVTQGDFLELMGYNPSKIRGEDRYPVDRVGWFDAVLYCNARSRRDGLDTVYRYAGRTEYTIAGVDAPFFSLSGVVIEYGNEGYRLPTEAEWEYACRAGSDSAYSFGGTDSLLDAYGWYYGNSYEEPHPVARKAPSPSPFGLYDMHGNVWEWCNDWYGSYDPSGLPETDPTGATAVQVNKVLRGGSFTANTSILRSAQRYPNVPYLEDYSHNDFGFRTVLPVK